MKHVLNTGIALSSNVESEKDFVKMAILCRTGSWLGMNGEVEVTKEMLERVANWTNTNYAHVLNRNSYPPIQLEHRRDAQETQGRVDISFGNLIVEEASKYNKVWDGHVLVGPLRVDDEVGQKNVDCGKYAKLSMSFDDEIGELYEVSFVAVEAARGSQILKQGDGAMPKELEAAQKQVTNLSAKVTRMKSKNQGASLALLTLKKGIDSRVKNLGTSLSRVSMLASKAEVVSQFKGFIKLGKMTKAEFDKINFEEYAALPPVALSAIVDSYKGRQVSSETRQHGSVTAASLGKVELSDAQYKEALKAQQEGRTYSVQNLSEGEEGNDESNLSDEEKEKQNLSGEEKAPFDLSEIIEEMKKLSAEVEELKKLSKLAEDEKDQIDQEGEE